MANPFTLAVKLPKAMFPDSMDSEVKPVVINASPLSFDSIRKKADSIDPYNRLMQGIVDGVMSGVPELAHRRIKAAQAYHQELSESAVAKFGKTERDDPMPLLGTHTLQSLTKKHERDSYK